MTALTITTVLAIAIAALLYTRLHYWTNRAMTAEAALARIEATVADAEGSLNAAVNPIMMASMVL